MLHNTIIQSIQKSIVLLYINNEKLEKEIKILFMIDSKYYIFRNFIFSY